MNSAVPPRGRVLLTGATGFIGRHLLKALLQEGWEVTAVVRHPPAALPGAIRDRLTVLPGDLGDEAFTREVVSRADAVAHLAAFIPPNLEDPSHAEACVRVNALLTLRLAEAACERPGKTFVYFSSGQGYRDPAANATETDPVFPSQRASYYLASKLLGEVYVEHLRRSRGLAAHTFRVGSCYGPGMPARQVVARFLAAAAEGRPLEVHAGGTQRQDFVYIQDVVGLALSALAAPAPGVYNAGSGRAHSVLELADAIAGTFPSREVEIRVSPAAGPPPPDLPQLDVSKARATWGYRPRPLPEGLADFRRVMEARS